MFYSKKTEDTRQLFFISWQKYRDKQPLLPLENQLVEVILAHPEYQPMLEKASPELAQTYFPELGETNPFLHMGLHLAIRDQVATDRPQGMAAIFQTLLTKHQDALSVEHLIMPLLAECLWKAQRHHTMPDELDYLHHCQTLLT